MTLKLPTQVESLCAQLERAGFEAYVVGGAIRDLLRGVTPKDYDVATSATPQEVQALFEKTVPTGIQHGTITVIIDEMSIEVTTFRSDVSYDDKRRPTQVIFNKDIKEDLQRRDFTINAMAYRPATTEIVDPFGGQKDLQDKIIRCVGEAETRFEEDALRMMRALRFLAVLPGFSMDGDTISAISRKCPLIGCVSQERIWQELSKTLLGKQAGKSMDVYFKTRLAYEITRRKYDLTKKNLIKNFDALPNNLSTRFAAFSLMRGYASTGFVSDFGRMDRKVTNRALDLLKIQYFEAKTNTKEEYARRWIKQVGKDAAEDAIELYYHAGMITDEDKKVLSEQLSLNPAIATHELAIGGEKLLEMCGGVGGWVGDTYRFLLDAVIKYPENNSEHRLIELAKMHINQIPKNLNILYAAGDAEIFVGGVCYAKISKEGKTTKRSIKAIPEIDVFVAKLAKTHQDLWVFMNPVCEKLKQLNEKDNALEKVYFASQAHSAWTELMDSRQKIHDFRTRLVKPFLENGKYWLTLKDGFWVKARGGK